MSRWLQDIQSGRSLERSCESSITPARSTPSHRAHRRSRKSAVPRALSSIPVNADSSRPCKSGGGSHRRLITSRADRPLQYGARELESRSRAPYLREVHPPRGCRAIRRSARQILARDPLARQEKKAGSDFVPCPSPSGSPSLRHSRRCPEGSARKLRCPSIRLQAVPRGLPIPSADPFESAWARGTKCCVYPRRENQGPPPYFARDADSNSEPLRSLSDSSEVLRPPLAPRPLCLVVTSASDLAAGPHRALIKLFGMPASLRTLVRSPRGAAVARWR